MEPGGSLPHSQEPATCPYPEQRLKYKEIKFLPALLNGCETWSLTLRENRRLRVFENRVLRKILGPKR
jgi:hypothetical protein